MTEYNSQSPSTAKSTNTVNPTLAGNKVVEAAKGAISTAGSFVEGVATAVVKDLTYNTQVYGPIQQNQTTPYYLGESIGHTVIEALGKVATAALVLGVGAADIGLGATGVGALATPAVSAVGIAAAGYTAGVTAIAIQNQSASINQFIQSTQNGGSGNSVTTNKGNDIDITPSANHSTTTTNPGLKGTPNSSVDILNKNGEVVTRRWFGPDGTQIRDVDFSNHGNAKMHPEWPHEHGIR